MKPDSAVQIVRKLRAAGYEAYFVGGCVRDMVAGREPSDYDIATSARPEEVSRVFPRTENVGAQFGVVLVIERGHPFEVATFRSDEAYIDGRRPTGVVFTDAQTDVLRRDFTINGLLWDPIEQRLIDYVGGQDDIRNRIIRAIGDPFQRFEEDKLRVLRAIRFGARLGYTIESATWNAVRAMAPKIHQVSRERIREEVVRILTEGQAARGLRMLEESGLRAEVVPEVQWSDHLESSVAMLAPGAATDFAMGVFLHETGVRDVERVVDRLRLSNAERRHTLELVGERPRFAEVRRMPVAALKRFFRLDRFEDHLELARICATASGSSLDDHVFAMQTFRAWGPEQITPVPLITGDDLIAMGFVPGPAFKEMLLLVEDEQLEGRVQNREQALDLLKTYPARER